MIDWSPRLICNVVYALLAERALTNDGFELVLSPHVKDEARPDIAQNRAELDAWLSAPTGRMALAEQALIRELGGAA